VEYSNFGWVDAAIKYNGTRIMQVNMMNAEFKCKVISNWENGAYQGLQSHCASFFSIYSHLSALSASPVFYFPIANLAISQNS